MSPNKRIEIKEKIQNSHPHIQIINALLDMSNGQIVVNGFENRLDNIVISGWRYLGDDKEQVRDSNGNLITG
jgi:hypothetical protein